MVPRKPIFNNRQDIKWELSPNSNEKTNKRGDFGKLDVRHQTFANIPESFGLTGERRSTQPATFEIPARPGFHSNTGTDSNVDKDDISQTTVNQNTERTTTIESFLPQLTKLMGGMKGLEGKGYPQLQSEDLKKKLSASASFTTRSTTMIASIGSNPKDNIDNAYLDKVYTQLNKAIKTLSTIQNQDTAYKVMPSRSASNIPDFKASFPFGNQQFNENGYKTLKNTQNKDILSGQPIPNLENSVPTDKNKNSSSKRKLYNALIDDLFGQEIPKNQDGQSNILRNALLQQLKQQSLSGVGIKNPSAVGDWEPKLPGLILSDSNLPSKASNTNSNQRLNSFSMSGTSGRNPGLPMKTGVSRLKLPPVISSTFSFNPLPQITQEEVAPITSLGPVNVPDALRQYGNLDKIASLKGTIQDMLITRAAEIQMNKMANTQNGVPPFRNSNQEMSYNAQQANRVASPLDQNRNPTNGFRVTTMPRNGLRAPPTMYPVYQHDADHIKGLFRPNSYPQHTRYPQYNTYPSRNSYKRLVGSSKVDTLDQELSGSNELPNVDQRNEYKSMKPVSKPNVITLSLTPQSNLTSNKKDEHLEYKDQGKTDSVDVKKKLLKKLLKEFYNRKSSNISKRQKRSSPKMLRPPTAWIKYYSNSSNSNDVVKNAPSKMEPTMYASNDVNSMDGYYQQMMMNYNNQSGSNFVEGQNNVNIETSEDFTSNLPSDVIEPPGEAAISIPILETASNEVRLPKPEAIKKAEISAAEIQAFDTTAIQSLVAQASILGQATVNDLSISSSISFNKLIIAALLSLIPTIAIAIPFLAPNMTRRSRRRHRYFRIH